MKCIVRYLVFCWMGFLSCAVLASDVEGTWTGAGVMIQKSNIAPIDRTEPCSKMEISFSQGGESLVVERYHSQCGATDVDWKSLKFEIKGTKVYNDGEEVGSFDGDIFKTLLPSSNVKYAFNFQLVRQSGKVVSLRSYYGVQNMVGTIVIEGTLAKP